MINKIFILTLKYIPIIQMVGMFINSLNYLKYGWFDSYFLDFIIGNSLITTFLLFICSYVFRFCNWYRYIIITNFINIVITNVDAWCYLNIDNAKLLDIISIVNTIGIICSLYSKLYRKHEKCIK